jgi:hypothetical protein
LAIKLYGTKNIIFQKRTGEVVENKGNSYITSQKRTGNEPKHEAEKLLKTRSCGKSEPRTNRKTNGAMFLKIEEGKNGPPASSRLGKNLKEPVSPA